jgi:hypothetical protein
MKKIRLLMILFLLCTGMLVFNSCQKDEEAQKKAFPNLKGVTVKDGILNFSSRDDYFKTNEALSKMTDQELDAWEKHIGFNSLRSELKQVFNLLDTAKSENEFSQILASNSDIISVIDGEVKPLIDNSLYPTISNRKGLFYVDGIIHKVNSTQILTSSDGKVESIDNYLLGKLNLENPQIRSKDYVFYTNSLKSVNEDRTIDHSKESALNGTKKCQAHCQAIREVCYGCCNNYYWTLRIKIFDHALVKRTIGSGYKLYSSCHECWNVNFHIGIPHVTGYTTHSIVEFQDYSETITHGGVTASMETSYWLNVSVGDQVQNIDYSIDFSIYDGEFQTGGSDPNRAIF